MNNPDSRLVPPPEPSPDKSDIIWQVLELSFPEAANLYEAAELLITKVNSLYNSPSASKEERWLFEPKKRDGYLSPKGKIPPNISFLAFMNQDNHPTCLVYDELLFGKALSGGDNIIIIPMGGASEVIVYTYYYAAKLAKPTDRIPPLPERFVTGYLFKEKEGDSFTLKSIYFPGDAKERYAIAMEIRGFPTAVYDDIKSLHRYTPEYREQKIERIIQEHGLPENIKRQQLLEYNPPDL